MTTGRVRATAATLLLLLACAAALPQVLHETGQDRLDAMFSRALVTFAAARGLNSVISVVQGTELALQPAGVGVTITVGQALDPLNDLVERFSWLMLAATAALGTQAVLLEASDALVVTVAFAAAAALLLARIWWPPLARLDATGLIPRLFVVLLYVRLAIPLAALGAETFSAAWLEPRRAAAVEALESTREHLDTIEARSPEPELDADSGVFESMRRLLDEQTDRLDLEARLAALSDRLDDAAERVIDLVVVFTLQTIVVPLAVLWALWRLAWRLVQTTRHEPWRTPHDAP